MSIQAINWAFQQEIFTSSDKFVLVSLCNYISDSGKSYPAVKTICRLTSLNEKTVRAALTRLEKDQWIADTGKRTGDTKQIKVYQLPPAAWELIEPKNGRFSKVGRRWVEGGSKIPKTGSLPYIEDQPVPGNREGEEPGEVTCNGIKITMDMVLKWLKVWNDSGSDYTEEEAKSAYLAMQAGGWMWGKNRVQDPRSAIERQIQTDRRNGKSQNGSLPIWRQLEILEEAIQKHPANRNSTYFKTDHTERDRADLKLKCEKLKSMKSAAIQS